MSKLLMNVEVDGRSYEIDAHFEDCRDGFNHVAEITSDHGQTLLQRNKCHYINRTWEAWTFQTVIKGALYNMKHEVHSDIVAKAKNLLGYKRETPKVKELVAFIENGGTNTAIDTSYESRMSKVIKALEEKVNSYTGYGLW
jgi:hypothetical protein